MASELKKEEEIKVEEVKAEEVKVEEVKAEEVKVEEVKTEENAEEVKAERRRLSAIRKNDRAREHYKQNSEKFRERARVRREAAKKARVDAIVPTGVSEQRARANERAKKRYHADKGKAAEKQRNYRRARKEIVWLSEVDGETKEEVVADVAVAI